MRTSQLAIIAIMVMVLGALSFLYLSEDREIKRQQQEQQDSSFIPNDSESKKTETELQLVNAGTRISELEKELILLRLQQQDAGGEDKDEASYTLSGDGDKDNPLLAENQFLRAEIERLKNANNMANLESGILLKNDVDKKQEEILLEQAISTARTVAKVGAIDLQHQIVVIAPIGQPNFNTNPQSRDRLIVRRDGKYVAKLIIDTMDSESSNYIASIDPSIPRTEAAAIKEGDDVILAPKSEANDVDALPDEPIATPLNEVNIDFGGSAPVDDSVPDLPVGDSALNLPPSPDNPPALPGQLKK